MKTRTALVRLNGNLTIKRYDDYRTNKEFAEDLRANGYRVLKIWAKDVPDSEVYEWEFLNRKGDRNVTTNNVKTIETVEANTEDDTAEETAAQDTVDNTVWYAVVTDDDSDWSTGSHNYDEALTIANKLTAFYDKVTIVTVDISQTDTLAVKEEVIKCIKSA